MNNVVSNQSEAAAQQALDPKYISGWFDGHRAQAGKLVAAAKKATENISSGSTVEAEFNALCWTIYRAWTRDGHRES